MLLCFLLLRLASCVSIFLAAVSLFVSTYINDRLAPAMKASTEEIADLYHSLKNINLGSNADPLAVVRDAHESQTDGVWRKGHIDAVQKAILVSKSTTSPRL